MRHPLHGFRYRQSLLGRELGVVSLLRVDQHLERIKRVRGGRGTGGTGIGERDELGRR